MAILPALLGGTPPPPQPPAPAPLAPPPPAGAPALAHVLDHVAQAQARLLTQYKDKPLFLGLVAALAGRAQVMEDALWQLLTQRSLTTAVGAQLDGIGKIVGLARAAVPGGTDDTVYRLWLRAEILVNLSNGTIPDLDAIIALTATPGTVPVIAEVAPAGIVVQLGVSAQTQGPALAAIIQRAKAAGVNATVDYLATSQAFGFDGATGYGFDTGYFGGSI